MIVTHQTRTGRSTRRAGQMANNRCVVTNAQIHTLHYARLGAALRRACGDDGKLSSCRENKGCGHRAAVHRSATTLAGTRSSVSGFRRPTKPPATSLSDASLVVAYTCIICITFIIIIILLLHADWCSEAGLALEPGLV